MFTQISLILQSLVTQFGPLGIAIATMIESFFVPIPSEVILIAAGTTIESHKMLLSYIFASALGAYIGSLPFYLIGRKSETYARNFCTKYGKYLTLTTEKFEYGQKIFQQKGQPWVLVGRMIPVIRSVISLPAGVAKMDFRLYSLYTFLGSSLWNALLIGGGYIFKDLYSQFVKILDIYNNVALVLIAIVCAIWFFRYWKKSKS